ncbi:MAG TPA: MSMEG_0570 family nitrogen starvation response protein [Polyangia bacterium]|nr:MSMEG_0570 family nitrogen starvation response protein [Polyangia bacterium]
MPEMHFVIRWPDGSEDRCYSPSLIVREYLEVGRAYPLVDFLERSRTMLRIGSDRVRAKYGYACSGALDQLAAIEERAAGVAADAPITVVAFELPPNAPPLEKSS